MAPPQQRVLRNDVLQAERGLLQVEAQHGKDSPEYRQALTRMARLWSVLKLTRGQDEFLQDLLR